MRILFVGDVYGKSGRDYLYENIKRIKDKHKINMVVVNGENISHGRGISKKIYKELMELGISAITMGNHTWGNKDIKEILEGSKIVIPANYPRESNNGFITINYNEEKVTIINLLGRVYMNYLPLDCPFKKAKEIIDSTNSDYYLIDFHAEATSEKIALSRYLDGINGAIVGTHTHVQTADERVLPNGTMYITDVGMTGPLNGVIGVDEDIIVNRFVNGDPSQNKTALGPRQLSAVVIDMDNKSIERIYIHE